MKKLPTILHQLAILMTLVTGLVVSGFTVTVIEANRPVVEEPFGCIVIGPFKTPLTSLSLTEEEILLYDEGLNLFMANCYSCHRIHTDWTGPALGGVTERQDREWLYAWIRNNGEVLASGDRYANELYQEWGESIMTNFAWMEDAQIEAILTYIEIEEQREMNY